MDEDVETPPFFRDRREQRIHLPGVTHLQWQQQRRLDHLGQWLDIGPGSVVQISHRDLGAGVAHHLRAAPSDRALIGDTHNQTAFSRHQRYHHRHSSLCGSLSTTAAESTNLWAFGMMLARRPRSADNCSAPVCLPDKSLRGSPNAL